MKIKPMPGKVLVRTIVPNDLVTEGGIVLLDEMKDRSVQGIVLEVGEGSTFQVGQEVLVAKGAGNVARVDGKVYDAVFRERHVLGTIDRF